MLSLIPDLSSILPYIIAVISVLAGFFGYGALQKAKGKKNAETKQRIEDHENAAEIRKRVERDLPDRVHEHDGSGWRD